MKTRMLILLGMVLFGTSMAFAQAKTEKFEVKGNCGMCETRIEKAAKSVAGVVTADWDQKTRMLAVSFKESETSVEKIQKVVAESGHDTPGFKAKDEVYNKLPGCCKYDRTDAREKSPGHKH